LCFVKWREKGCLPFLFSSESSLPSSKSFPSSSDPLPAPTISTDPSYDVYYEGERFAVVCNAPKERKIGGFQFFNQSGQKINQRAPHAFPTAWLQLTAAEASAGEYTCMYFVEELGQEVPSKRSLPLSVKVQGRLVLSAWLGYHQSRHRMSPFRESSCLMALCLGCQWTEEVAVSSHKLLLCSWFSLSK